MDLDNDGGVCNAILYDRETKVVRINIAKGTTDPRVEFILPK